PARNRAPWARPLVRRVAAGLAAAARGRRGRRATLGVVGLAAGPAAGSVERRAGKLVRRPRHARTAERGGAAPGLLAGRGSTRPRVARPATGVAAGVLAGLPGGGAGVVFPAPPAHRLLVQRCSARRLRRPGERLVAGHVAVASVRLRAGGPGAPAG